MPKLSANPAAEASVAFDTIKPGVQRMRVDEISEFTAKSGNTCWKVKAVYAMPGAQEKLDGSGVAQNPGCLFDNSLVVSPAEKQGKVRSFVEALGVQWSGDIDSDTLIGIEFDARIGTEKGQDGELRNIIARYLPKQ